MLRGKKLFVAFMFFVIATTAPGISEAQNTRLLSMLSCPGLAPLDIDLSDYIPTNSGDGICWCFCRLTGNGLVWMCDPGGCDSKDGTDCSDARIPPTDIGRDILINELASLFKQFPDIPINGSRQCLLTSEGVKKLTNEKVKETNWTVTGSKARNANSKLWDAKLKLWKLNRKHDGEEEAFPIPPDTPMGPDGDLCNCSYVVIVTDDDEPMIICEEGWADCAECEPACN